MSRQEQILGGLFAGVVILLVALVLLAVHEGQQDNRDGCERVNVLRVNQARLLRDQIAASERGLRRSLGPLEAFREEAEDALAVRKAALRRLRESVKEHPVKGKPYEIDCAVAFP